MKAVIVLTLLVQLSQVVEYVHCDPQLKTLGDLLPLLQLGQCFPIPLPPSPPTCRPVPPCAPAPPCAPVRPCLPAPPRAPVPPRPPVLLPPPPPPAPPCSKLPTGALAALLDIIGNRLNLPKGTLSKVPLCCKRSVPSEPDPDVFFPPLLNSPQSPNPPLLPGPVPDLCSLTPDKLQMLIAQLSTPQALDPQIKIPYLQTVLGRSLLAPPTEPSPPIFIPSLPCPQGFPQPRCVTHHLESCVRPVVDECIKNVPVYQNTIRSCEERVVKHIPVWEKMVTNQAESFIRQVPIMQKFTRPVIETSTRHIPVIRKRFRTVVEPYTSHIPILVKCTRPVEETIIRNVPVMQRRCRPVLVHTVRQVPITQTNIRPVVEARITQVPVKQKIVKNFIEHRVKKIIGPCCQCRPCCNPCHYNCPFPPNSRPIINQFPSHHLEIPRRLSIHRPPFPPCPCPMNFS